MPKLYKNTQGYLYEKDLPCSEIVEVENIPLTPELSENKRARLKLAPDGELLWSIEPCVGKLKQSIQKFKSKLDESDYKIIKYAEGIPVDDLNEVKAERALLRSKINLLEEEIVMDSVIVKTGVFVRK